MPVTRSASLSPSRFGWRRETATASLVSLREGEGFLERISLGGAPARHEVHRRVGSTVQHDLVPRRPLGIADIPPARTKPSLRITRVVSACHRTADARQEGNPARHPMTAASFAPFSPGASCKSTPRKNKIGTFRDETTGRRAGSGHRHRSFARGLSRERSGPKQTDDVPARRSDGRSSQTRPASPPPTSISSTTSTTSGCPMAPTGG